MRLETDAENKIMRLHAETAARRIDSAFQSPVFAALTIGVPFCVFKLLFGWLFICINAGHAQVLFGWLVIAWAAADLAMNLARALFHMTGRASPIEYCTIAQAGRLINRPKLFLAIDTFLSFSIICFVLWSSWIKLLGPANSYLWYAATTLNLMGISLVSLWLEYRRNS
jgi:hypothetical protein